MGFYWSWVQVVGVGVGGDGLVCWCSLASPCSPCYAATMQLGMGECKAAAGTVQHSTVQHPQTRPDVGQLSKSVMVQSTGSSPSCKAVVRYCLPTHGCAVKNAIQGLGFLYFCLRVISVLVFFKKEQNSKTQRMGAPAIMAVQSCTRQPALCRQGMCSMA
jgi:hypothetical protein